jgi:prolipoprotein diacylglyceryl transferase
MYPNLYYAFKDLFGVDWPGLSLINSFGFFVALAFIVAAVVLGAELKRKSKEGLLSYEETEIVVGEPASISELLFNFGFGFLFGYKFIGALLNGSDGGQNPQDYLFSSQGNWLTGIALGLFFAGARWWEKKKQALPTPEKRRLRIWPQDRVGDIVILAAVFGFAGAKLFDILESPSDFALAIQSLRNGENDVASVLFSGLTFYGGLICAALAIWWYARKHKIGFWHLNDSAAPALMIAYAIGRIGCQVSGDGDWGIVNAKPNPYGWLPDWLWSYQYPNNVLGKGVPIPGCVGQYCNQLPEPVYPTPLYEVLMGLALFALLWSLRKKLKVPGTLFAVYLFVNGLERFLIEKIRVNATYDLFGFHPTQAELISFALMAIGAILFFFLRKRSRTSTTS